MSYSGLRDDQERYVNKHLDKHPPHGDPAEDTCPCSQSELARLRGLLDMWGQKSGEQQAEIARLRESNARLLEALREVMEAMGGNVRFFKPNPPLTRVERVAFDKALAAIAAAEGEK